MDTDKVGDFVDIRQKEAEKNTLVIPE